MARPVVLSNGELHVGLNEYGLVHDFYFPYVGQENHLAARDLTHRVGVWVDDSFSWIDDGNWKSSVGYHPDTLIGLTTVTNEQLGVQLVMDDFVDNSQAAYIRNLQIINMTNQPRELRVFFAQVFVISNSLDSDTVQFVPEHNAILHYKGHRSFVIGARHSQGKHFEDYSVGLFGIEGHEGTYKDAEDGELSRNAVEHGKVDSVLSLTFQLSAHDSKRAHYWIAAGKSQREAFIIHNRISEEGALHYLATTATHWRSWLEPAARFAETIDNTYRSQLIRSVLTIKAHQDKRGAVIASTDTTMLNYSRDAYAYCWPRDGAYAMWPLIRLGFKDEPLHFFAFCRRSLHEDGYLQHKYQADGSLGSSWHPYVHGDEQSPPIQTDETASVLFVFQQYYSLHDDAKLLRDYYPTFVQPMANFLAGYVDKDGLPKPSYDLWEEKYLTSTYTTSVTYAALLAASDLADLAGNTDDALRWRSSAESMLSHSAQFYDQQLGYLIKGFVRQSDGSLAKDRTLDVSSLYGAYMFGLFEHSSPEITSTYQRMVELLATSDGLAFPRYEHDAYNTVMDIPNPWPICSLWMAQYADGQGNKAHATSLLDFVNAQSMNSGILSEQLHPTAHEIISVAPLTWSHAEFVSTLIDTFTTEEETS